MPEIHYKLTDENMRTHSACQWTLGEWKETSGDGELCGAGWLHCYKTPELAILLNPIHADFRTPRLFRAEGDGGIKRDGQLKLGRSRLRLVSEMPLPIFTTEQRIAFGILCAGIVYKDENWNEWAWSWILGVDRSDAAAQAAAAEGAAARAAAAWAAAAAAWAAAAAAAAWAADAAATAAAWAADAAAGQPLDLAEIARVALAWDVGNHA